MPVAIPTQGQNQYAQYPTLSLPSPSTKDNGDGTATYSNYALQSPQALLAPFQETQPQDFRPFTPLVTGGGKIKTVWPVSADLFSELSTWLHDHMGQGATPYGGQAALPSGGQSQAGAVTAPLNPIAQALQRYYQTGDAGGIPGLQNLTSMASDGSPTDVGPAWEAMVAAQKRNIDQGAANVREQLSFAGNLKGTPFANAIGDYYEQAGKDQNATLAQMHLSAAEAAKGRMQSAQQLLYQGVNDFSNILQGYDQEAIRATMAEFLRTQPEYAPLLNMIFSLATTFPPTVGEGQGFGVGATGAILQGSASLLDAISGLRGQGNSRSTISGGGGTGTGGYDPSSIGA